MVLKSKLRIILSKIFLGYEILEISITTDAQHSTCPSCNLLQRIVGRLSYPYKTAKSHRILSLVKEEFPDLLPKYLALYKTAYAPKAYTGKIYRTVETVQRRCGFKKFEMPMLKEKQTKLEDWAKNDEN
jgi:hypothetical protein